MVRSFSVCLFLLALAVPSLATAQEAPPLDQFSVMRFSPAPGPGNYLHVDGARVGGHLVPAFGFHLDWAHRPFTLFTVSCATDDETNCQLEEVNTPLIRFIFAGHLSGAVAFADRVQVGLSLPVAWARGEGYEYTSTSGAPIIINNGRDNVWNDFAIGDPRLSAKVRLFGDGDGLAFAVVGWGTAPVGALTADGRYVGEDTFTGGGHFAAQLVQDRFHVAANVGGVYRPERVLFSTAVGSQITYAGVLGYDVTPLFTVFGEVQGGSSLSQAVDENTLEARLAARLTQGDFAFDVAGGAGLVAGVGVPLFRIVGGMRWAPVRTDSDGDGVLDADDGCPSEREDRDGWQDEDGCPEVDNDGDELLDAEDRCPDEAEDIDEHEDEDGCPDTDNDGDGVVDGYDSCPNVPEDQDGDRDEDGCPDNDRDQDGVPDDVDQCPDEEEDTDGYGDEDGCPEEDFDEDGIPDTADECPDEAETPNRFEDEDGCPDEAPARRRRRRR